jgi:hypothetical protein
LKGLAHGERKNNGPKTFQQTHYTRSTDGDITPSAGLTGPYSLQDPFPNGLIPQRTRKLGLLTNSEIRQARTQGPERYLLNALKRRDFPILDFPGTAKSELG